MTETRNVSAERAQFLRILHENDRLTLVKHHGKHLAIELWERLTESGPRGHEPS